MPFDSSPRWPFDTGSMTWQGRRIIVTPDVPKMKLAPGDYVTAECRAETDRWLLEFFGTTNAIADGSTFVVADALYMNPRTFENFKRALK